MRTLKGMVLGVLFVLAAAASVNVHAHGVRFGFHFGMPFYPWYYPPPAYYYPPPVVTVPAAPPVYIEPPQAQGTPPQEQWWYLCPDSNTYYPYVQSCASEWQRVPTRPPGT